MTETDTHVADVSASAALECRAVRSDWRVLLAGAAFVIGVAAVFSFVMSENPDQVEPAVYSPAFTGSLSDSFDRPASVDDPGDVWTSVRGTWGVQVGVTHLTQPDPDLNLMVADIGSRSVSVGALVGGDGVCGVVARYTDEKNYIALVRAAGYGVWNVLTVVNGSTTVIGVVGDSGEGTVGVRLDVGDDVVVATVGIRQGMFNVNVPFEGSQVGLIALNGGDRCAWDLFNAGVAR